MRGIMQFDDYNYEMYNKYILIDPNKPNTTLDEQDFDENGSPIVKKELLGFAIPVGGKEPSEEDAKSVALTEKLLETAVKISYTHETLDV